MKYETNALEILKHIAKNSYVYTDPVFNQKTEALEIAIKEMEKLNKIKEYFVRIIERNSKYMDNTYKITDLSTLVVHTEIKSQNEIINSILDILNEKE